MDKEIIELLKQMDKKADSRHAEVLERLTTVDNRLNGIANQFEQTAKERITDNDFINHRINKLEKEIFELKKAK